MCVGECDAERSTDQRASSCVELNKTWARIATILEKVPAQSIGYGSRTELRTTIDISSDTFLPLPIPPLTAPSHHEPADSRKIVITAHIKLDARRG